MKKITLDSKNIKSLFDLLHIADEEAVKQLNEARSLGRKKEKNLKEKNYSKATEYRAQEVNIYEKILKLLNKKIS